MKIPYTKDEIDAAQLACVRDNKLESCYIRPIAFYGSQAMGVAAKSNPVRVAVAAWPWGAYLGAEGLEKGIRVKTSSFTRHHVNITMTGAKACANYLNSILANQEATHDGYDEALLLDAAGLRLRGLGRERVHRASAASCTRRTSARARSKGITRDTVMTLARELGIAVLERRIPRDEIYCADEAFFTGTAAEVTPIRELDNRTIGEGRRGPITAEAAGAVLRHRQRPQPGEDGVAREGVTMDDVKDAAAVEVDPKDLPVFCPNPAMPLWSSHPRVFLDIADDGQRDVPVLRHALPAAPAARARAATH